MEDIYCLSLCNHRLLAIFGSRMKREYLKRQARLSFLRRLERDHPRYFACEACLVLHNLGSISEPLGLSYPAHNYPPRLDCVRAPKFASCTSSWMVIHHHSSICSHYTLHFSHLQLAMRRFYYGPQCGISTDALSFTEVENDLFGGDRVSRPTTLFSIEAQICPKPPSLHLRIQEIISNKIISLEPDGEDYPEAQQNHFAVLRVCKHGEKSFWMQDITLKNTRPTSIRSANIATPSMRLNYLKIDQMVMLL